MEISWNFVSPKKWEPSSFFLIFFWLAEWLLLMVIQFVEVMVFFVYHLFFLFNIPREMVKYYFGYNCSTNTQCHEAIAWVNVKLNCKCVITKI